MILFHEFQIERLSKTVLKIFLQVTDPRVTNTGCKQDALSRGAANMSAATVEFKTEQNRTESKMLSHTMRLSKSQHLHKTKHVV